MGSILAVIVVKRGFLSERISNKEQKKRDGIGESIARNKQKARLAEFWMLVGGVWVRHSSIPEEPKAARGDDQS